MSNLLTLVIRVNYAHTRSVSILIKASFIKSINRKGAHSQTHSQTLLEAIAFSTHNNSTIMTQVEVEEDISLVGNNGGFNSVDESTNTEAKKKKKKKKRSKKKKAAPPTNSGQESNAGLSHQQLVLRSVMSEGYNEDEVNKAVGEMWDKSLMYDDVKAILKYLKGEKGGDDEDSDDEEKERKPRVEKEKDEEEKKEPPSASSSPSNSAPKVAQQPSSPKGQAVASPDMETWTFIKRLTYAASYNEMASSVYAIHTWSTSATNAELKQFVNNDVIRVFLKRAVECEESVWGKIKGNLGDILNRVGKGGGKAMEVLEGGREIKSEGGIEVSVLGCLRSESTDCYCHSVH